MSIRPVDHGVIASSAGGVPFTVWGGTINQYTVSSTTWRSHTFRGSGILETAGAGSVSAQWFILGAGGDGIQGGGGAGGVRQYDKSGEAGAITLNGGTDYTVTVGITAGKDYASSGGNSVFSGSDITDITALGGGKGGAGAGSAGGAPTDGGSGGGGGASAANTPQPGQGSDGSPLQGRDGGAGNQSVSGGGGGGYGSNGGAAGGYNVQGGNGGTGGTLMSFGAVTAHSTAVYAGGGGGIGIGGVEGQGGSDVGGDAIYTSSPAFPGVANTGSGGGSHYGQASAGGFGSAGIVIIRYVVA